MIIQAIHLQNFKSYYGTHHIENLDKGLTSDQNVVLIGGTNGAGKTTFLEAIFLCFYGNNAIHHYPSKGARNEVYNTFIHSMLNKKEQSIVLVNAKMSIEIDLKAVSLFGSIERNITFKRSWSFPLSSQAKFIEDFVILENGQPIEGLEEKDYEAVIRSYLPYNVAQFFFFDGEKIQEFAKDTDGEFAASLKDVLDITLYSTLEKDLKDIRSRILTEYNQNKEAQVELKKRQLKETELENDIETKKRAIGVLDEEISEINVEIEKKRVELQRTVNLPAETKEQFEIQRREKEAEKLTLENQYMKAVKDDLPFILAGGMFERIEKQLDLEERYEQIKAAQAQVEPQIQSILSAVFDEFPKKPVNVNGNIKNYYQYKIDEALRSLWVGQNKIDPDFTPIHDLRKQEIETVRTFFKSLNNKVFKIINETGEDLKKVNLVLETIRNTENRSGGRNEIVQNLYAENQRLSEELGVKKNQIQNLSVEISERQREIEIVRREITNWENRSIIGEKHKRQIEYTEKLRLTTQEFQKRFQAKRTNELEKEILSMWGQLTHKPEKVGSVRISPDANFEIKLFDTEGVEDDKTKFSAGEKEIYAISLLWALVQVSGKRLPIIIDTPFGRLDSIHRMNLVKKYLPLASHQVIILSQDEEIVGEYYEELKPFISQELGIDNINGASEIKAVYPFKK